MEIPESTSFSDTLGATAFESVMGTLIPSTFLDNSDEDGGLDKIELGVTDIDPEDEEEEDLPSKPRSESPPAYDEVGEEEEEEGHWSPHNDHFVVSDNEEEGGVEAWSEPTSQNLVMVESSWSVTEVTLAFQDLAAPTKEEEEEEEELNT